MAAFKSGIRGSTGIAAIIPESISTEVVCESKLYKWACNVKLRFMKLKHVSKSILDFNVDMSM